MQEKASIQVCQFNAASQIMQSMTSQQHVGWDVDLDQTLSMDLH